MAPMTRRRSARIASATKPTEYMAQPGLAPLIEDNEASPIAVPRTPASSSPTKPTNSEMNPSKSKLALPPPSSAVRLGFVDIPQSRRGSAHKSARGANITEESAEATVAALQATPSKKSTAAPPSSSFTFRFTRTGTGKTADAGLSKEALRMMEELREETLRIRADMEVERAEERAKAEAEEHELDVHGRRIAKPRGRAGRYSAAHSAEFQKMDSIANHPSAFRAAAARHTPVKTAIPAPAPSSVKRGLKRTQSKANLDDGAKHTLSTKKSNASLASSSEEGRMTASGRKDKPSSNMPIPAAKRVKQRLEDDASSSRPISRDGSSLPRPTTAVATGSVARPTMTTSSTMPVLLTPTKSLLGRSASVRTPGTAKTPVFGSALKKSATTNNLHSPSVSDLHKARPVPTVRLVGAQAESETKTADHGVVANTVAKRRALPVPAAPAMPFSKTPAPPRASKPLLRYPATTPTRKMAKHVAFTPTTQRALFSEMSPSLFRSFIPRSGMKPAEGQAAETNVNAPALSTPAKELPSVRRFTAVLYPDLSKHQLLTGLGSEDADVPSPSPSAAKTARSAKTLEDAKSSVPGTFSFRSDKTIEFGAMSPTGFGASPGQSSLRQVRQSTAAGLMPRIPGSFPGFGASSVLSEMVATEGPNKENARPVSIPHGIANKKRHRVSEAKEAVEEAAAERAAKRRKNEQAPEGEALLAPRLVAKGETGSVRNTPQRKMAKPSGSFGSSSSKTPASAVKKRPVLSLSRLNSLARPKLRK